MSLLNTMSRLALRVGLHVQRANPMTMWNMRLPKMLEQHSVQTVLDIGANDGGYASSLLNGGFMGTVVSFEPLPDAWKALKKKAASRGSRWQVAERMALSDAEGEASFYCAANSTSSSLLPMAEAHLQAAPHSRTLGKMSVNTYLLDNIIGSLEVKPPFFIKIDVQGAEMMVLNGARRTLSEATVGLQVETSLQNLYEGQPPKSEMERLVDEMGFSYWDIVPGFRDQKSLKLLQYDGIYFK